MNKTLLLIYQWFLLYNVYYYVAVPTGRSMGLTGLSQTGLQLENKKV